MSKGPILSQTRAFAVRIIRFVRYMQEEKKEFVLSKQILRSGTCIGANCRESNNAQSKADFINKLSIALKEADETAYWLEIMFESETIDKTIYDSLYADLDQIIAMLVTSLKTSKQ